MKKYNVLAQAFNRDSGEVEGAARWELIDPLKNILFKNCENLMDIKLTYESFWNDLNPDSEEVVFVQQIKIIS